MPAPHPPKTKMAAAAGLAAGETADDIATKLGLNPRTVRRWKADDPGFLGLVRDAEARQLEAWDALAALATQELHRRLVDNPEALETRDLVGIATRAGHHTNLTLSRGVEAKPEQRVALTPEQQAQAAEALREMAESADGA